MKKILCTTILITILNLFVVYTYAENTINVEINYGKESTQDNLVSLKVISNTDLTKYYIQFSIDNQNWYGYDFRKNSWIKDYVSKYSEFYPNFNIGNNKGTKTVYVRGLRDGNILWNKKNVKLTPYGQEPIVENQVSKSFVENNSNSSTFGMGTLDNPYVVAAGNEYMKISSSMASYFSVSYDGISWSKYEKINNGVIEKKLNISDFSVVTPIYVKSVNEFGVESAVRILYYVVDNSSPQCAVSTSYNSYLAISGECQLLITCSDDFSDFVDYTIELIYDGYSKYISGRVNIYENGIRTSQKVLIGNLPNGVIEAKVIFSDKVGNQTFKNFQIVSY